MYTLDTRSVQLSYIYVKLMSEQPKHCNNMKHYYLLPLLAALLSFCSCSSDDQLPKVVSDDFAGRYEIISITSGQALDLNNDGISSNDLYSEYSSKFHWENALYLPIPYDFTNPYNYACFRRNELLEINLAEFRFPCQYLNDIEWADSPIPLLRNYNWGFSNMYYQLANDGQVKIIPPTNPGDEPVDNMGYITSLKRLSKDVFQIEVTIQVYDFKRQEWVVTPVWAVYERRVAYMD